MQSETFTTRPTPKKAAWALALPILIWGVLFALRPHWITTWCAVDPTPCLMDTVNALDRLAFEYGSIRADFWSNVVQNTVGAAFYLAPFFLFWAKKITFVEAWLDLMNFIRITFWNLAINEGVRALVQRPRPLVYRSPLGDGASPHQYSSFFSGHTSFVAISTLTLYFYLQLALPGRKDLHRMALIASFALTILTGSLRVLGGRHYPTDTIVGAAVGMITALWIHHRRFSQNRIIF